jgi:putative membrane protein
MITSVMSFHPGTRVSLPWTWDPLPLTTVAVATCAYVLGTTRLWQVAGRGRGLRYRNLICAAVGLATVLIALVSPLDGWSDSLFAAHMSQHELLMVVAAPLVVLGRPLTAYLWALPVGARRRVGAWLRQPAVKATWQFWSAPLFVLVLHAVVRWVWHVPTLFEAAMRHEALHAVQHFSFFTTAALFWWALVHGRYGKAGYGLGVLFVFATALHTSILGVLISVAPRVVYHIYESRVAASGWDALADQELAGLIMWVPSGLLFLVCALALFAAWLGEAERRAARNTMSGG